ncbi:glycerophosphodiester phosphodiesterase family protein [Paenibacillus lautus]|jgi:glycerophosphoryl diester phosphodiesterase|uniref:glycerophosphodiester phosphodiesterase n=1 Tax=Paenibacillus lautus TaxID=1401 RepID=UPI0026EB180E|nr:glycerophosphodiester phosphodiesterase family protein [Paenibacillus lautus]MCI1773131.1 glycerophosphodiester phosphodiesterase [Paenibacillus lautus]
MNMKPKYVAHRGLSLHAPENTIPAFELAGKSGFWGIECDTYCTTNGRWIVHHDRTVDRMTNGTGRTKDFSYEEIRKLHIVAGNGIDAYSNLQIPTLEEVLSVCLSYGMHAFIEIEEYHQDRDLEKLVSLVRGSGMHGQCSFICFNADDLLKVRAIDDRVPLGYLSSKPPAAADLELIGRMQPAFLDYDYRSTTPEDVRNCRRAGIDVSMWTVNDQEISKPFEDAGAVYITTDTILWNAMEPGDHSSSKN